MRPVTGGNMYMYRNTGTYTVPVWNLVSAVEDVSISNLTRGLAEIKIRTSQFTKNLAAIIDTIKVEFKAWYGIDSSTIAALITMFFGGNSEEWVLLDAPVTVTGAQGLRCPFIISDFPMDQNIMEAAAFNVGLSASYHESPVGTMIEPSWYTVAGASTTTTTALP